MIEWRLTVALALAAVLFGPSLARAQAGKVFRIGAVSAGAGRSSPHWIAFDQRLLELGYVEGQNLTVEFRNADGKPERLPGLMAELVRLGVDLIFAAEPEAALRAAKDSTTAIPIIVVAIDYDSIARGYVGGLARPGGNITGVFLRQLELTAKRVELLKEMVPNLREAVAFWDTFSADQLEKADAAARSVGLRLQWFEFRDPPYSFDGPMRVAVRRRAGALLGLASPVLLRKRAETGGNDDQASAPRDRPVS